MIEAGATLMASAHGSLATILVVEDQSAMRDLIRHMLESSSFAVIGAETAEAGLALLESHPEISLAIIDMVMPGMSGLDLAAELNRRRPGLQILYISGFVTSIAMQAIADRSPEVVLLKPFTEPRLVGRVRSLLGFGEEEAKYDSPVWDLASAWDRVIEGSDDLRDGVRAASYRSTVAAYSVAAAHAAILRHAELRYRFQRFIDPVHAIELLVPAEQAELARRYISMIGLGVDVAVAA